MGVRVEVRVGVRVGVRFALGSFGFSFIEYIHAASFSIWCEREIVDVNIFWFHWMRHCSVACDGAAGKLQGRGRRRFRWAWLEQQGSCRGEGGGGFVEARECSGVFSVHSGQ